MIRTHTPSVSGTRKNASSASVCRGRALLGKEQPPEGAHPRQHAGHRGNHPQLDQQRNQNEIVRHPINVSRRGAASHACQSSSSLRHAVPRPIRPVTAGRSAPDPHADVEWNMGFESVKKIAEADFPTRWGAFRILGFEGVLPGAAPTANRQARNGGRSRRPGRPGHGRHSRRAAAGPHSLAMPDRRRLRLAALRLPPATGTGPGQDRREPAPASCSTSSRRAAASA